MAPTVQLNEDVGQLQQAYVNEKCAPLLLPFAAELISKMFDVMDLQVRPLARAPTRAAIGRTTSARAPACAPPPSGRARDAVAPSVRHCADSVIDVHRRDDARSAPRAATLSRAARRR
jgi:hypothetical protein